MCIHIQLQKYTLDLFCIYFLKNNWNKLNLFKLHQHSHLYTSDSLIDFPGRCFKIKNTLPYNKQLLRKESINKANITTRNFPETVSQIRKKLKITDGGNSYMFFTTNIDENFIVLICSKSDQYNL